MEIAWSKSFVFLFILLFLAPLQALSTPSNADILKNIWEIGKKESCTTKIKKRFSPRAFEKLNSQISNPSNRTHLQNILNPFLFSLGKSHTEFFGPLHEGFHFFRSHAHLTNPKAPPPPNYYNPGLQFFAKEPIRIREVLQGFPGEKAGLRRNDKIITVNGKSFKGYWSEPGDFSLVVKRGEKLLDIHIHVPKINLSEALFSAQKKSVKIFDTPQGKIGYIRLWTGTHPKSAKHLKQIAAEFERTTQAMILDLRGGYGGAWWQHLDSFFRDRRDFFYATSYSTSGKPTKLTAKKKVNKNFYSKPLVVLINGGTRSGKEALAFQFKKSKQS